MKTVSIRDLRGAGLRESSLKGELLALANHRVLIGVFVPATSGWVEQVLDYNWSHVRQSIAEGEQAMAAGPPMVTLDGVLAVASDADDEGQSPDPREAATAGLAAQLSGAIVGKEAVLASASREAIAGLRGALGLPGPVPGPGAGQDEPPARTVRIGDLSAALIERAGMAGQTLAITHDRELIGIVIPVTPDLVQFLIEQNISRVLYNIGLGEKQIGTDEKLATLDQALGEASQARSGSAARRSVPGGSAPGTVRPRLHVLSRRQGWSWRNDPRGRKAG